jgi:hypothetical protein
VLVGLKETGQTVRENCFFACMNAFVKQDYDDFIYIVSHILQRYITRMTLLVNALAGVFEKAISSKTVALAAFRARMPLLELTIYTAKDEHMYILLPRMNATSGLLV